LYSALQGDPPLDTEEVTDAQLSALARVIDAGGSPFTDFGVWGPFGNRIAKQVRFTHNFLDGTGQWRAKELAGPDCIEAWERCWRVYRTAAIMLQLATPAVLDQYAAKFRHRVVKYPWTWSLCCLADQRCRGEWWVQEHRRQLDFHASNPTLSSFNLSMPWNSVIKASAAAPEFWKEELEEPALIRKVAGGRGGNEGTEATGGYRRDRSRSPGRGTSSGPGPRAGRTGRTRGGTGGGRGHIGSTSDAKAKDKGNKTHRNAPGGKQICFSWNRADGGCSDPCPTGRAHMCERCLQPHRGHGCTKNPSGGKGGGKAHS
jgi:hypothetical protein